MKPSLIVVVFLCLTSIASLASKPTFAGSYQDTLDRANGNVLSVCREGRRQFAISHWILGDIGSMTVSVKRLGDKLTVSRQADVEVSVNFPLFSFFHRHVSEGGEVWSSRGLEEFSYSSRDSSSNWEGEVRSNVFGRTSSNGLFIDMHVSGARQLTVDYVYPLQGDQGFALWTETPWCGAMINASSVVDVVEGKIFEYGKRTEGRDLEQKAIGSKVVESTVRGIYFNGIRSQPNDQPKTEIKIDENGEVEMAEFEKFGNKLKIILNK